MSKLKISMNKNLNKIKYIMDLLIRKMIKESQFNFMEKKSY